MSRVAIVVVALIQPETLDRLFTTARRTTHDLEFHLFLHSDHESTKAVCEAQQKHGDVVYYPDGTNRGLARGWNDGILAGYERGADVVVVANDDIWFSEGDLDKIVGAAMARRGCYVLMCSGYDHRQKRQLKSLHWAIFALNLISLEWGAGCFDENFFPAGFEDCDYVARSNYFGLPSFNVETVSVQHGGGATRLSSSMRAEWQESMIPQRQYWLKKWGAYWGDVANQDKRFRHPFNNTEFGFHISPEDRHAPYPGYNRRL